MKDKDKIKKITRTLILLLFSTQFISCDMVMATSEYLEIVVKGDSFTISWDDDSMKISSKLIRAEKYKIYYRIHGTSEWNFLGETLADPTPEFLIKSSELDFGKYDLGVCSVNNQGRESVIHSSLDQTADPFCGWYVNWIGTK